MFGTTMKKMAMPDCDMDKEEDSPDVASLNDLLTMVEQLIAQKGMSAKKKPAAEVSVTMVAPKDGEEGGMEGDESAMPSKEDDDEEEMKRKLLG